MRTSLFLVGLLAILLTSACGAAGTPESSKTPPAPAVQPKASYKPGSLLLGIPTAADTSQRYGVYLPLSYRADAAFPVLYLFDSHGRSGLPLERYRALADQFEWVLIASENSKNGQQPAQSLAIFDALRRDTREKLWLDSAQVFVGGFSGGARVAAQVAQSRPGIAGVIACGAGYQPRPQDKFAYIGLVGTEDFNYQEFRQLEQQMAAQGNEGLIEYFIGGHEWPAAPIMAKAFQYQQMRAMAHELRPVDATQVDGMLARYREQDSTFAATAQDRYRHELQQKTIAYLKGLTDTKAMEALYAQLDSSAQVQGMLQRREMDFEREMELRQDYGDKLQTASLPDWERITGMLRKVGKGEGEDAWLYMRLLNFLSLNCYMNATRALQVSDLPLADRMITIYSMVDPSNNEHAVLRAEWLMRSAAPTDALASLDFAFQLGFRDWQRLESAPAFQSLHAEPGFATLVSRMKADPQPAH